MKRMLCAATLLGLVTVIGCEQKSAGPTPTNVTSEDVRHDAGQAVNTAAEFSQETKEKFQKNLEAQLKDLDAEVAFDRKMADLEIKRDAARAKLAEVSQASAEAWKGVQKGAQSAWDDLDKAFHDASREF